MCFNQKESFILACFDQSFLRLKGLFSSHTILTRHTKSNAFCQNPLRYSAVAGYH